MQPGAGSAIFWIASAVLTHVACGSTLPVVPTGPHPQSARAEIVPYPPPAARVEIVPQRPFKHCLWLDGYYVWNARRWQWEDGRWVNPSPGCYFAPPHLTWTKKGNAAKRVYFPASFYRTEKSSTVTCPAPAPCSAG